MDVRPFPSPASNTPGAQAHAVDIDHLLTLTNSRLVRMTGSPDVIATRLGLRHLKRLGLKALVLGSPIAAVAAGWLSSANNEA